jgi:hypothetical protein
MPRTKPAKQQPSLLDLKSELQSLKQNLQDVEDYERWGGRPRVGWKEELAAKIKAAEEKLGCL